MYAIIEDGSHQYRVEKGDVLDVQLHELEDGQENLSFDRVLMIGDGESHSIGQPYVEGAKVTASITGEIKGDKLITIKYRRRKNSQTKKGHRQRYLRVKIDEIQGAA